MTERIDLLLIIDASVIIIFLLILVFEIFYQIIQPTHNELVIRTLDELTNAMH